MMKTRPFSDGSLLVLAPLLLGSLVMGPLTGCVGTIDEEPSPCEPSLELQNESTEALLLEITPLELVPETKDGPEPEQEPFTLSVPAEQIHTEALSFAGTYKVRAEGIETGREFLAETELGFACQTRNLIVFNEHSRILFDLHLKTTGTGVGRIVLADSELECRSECHLPQERGSVVRLRPEPSAGSRFSGWSGACSGMDICEVPMNFAQSVTASFEKLDSPIYGLQLEVEGSGKVVSYPSAIFCPNECDGSFQADTRVHLTAVHEAHQQFIEWEGDCDDRFSRECELEMDGPKSARAIFAPVMHTVSVQLSDGADDLHGPARAVSDPAGLICNNQPGGRTCSASFQEGRDITIRIEQPEGETYLYNWGGECSGTEDHTLECRFTIDQDSSVTISPKAPDPSSFIFYDEVFVSGLVKPGPIRFTSDGGLFVAEKDGIIKHFRNESDKIGNEVLDIRSAVNSYWDRGITDIEMDPDFPNTPHLYVLYTYDAPIGGTAPIYGDEDNRTHATPGPVSGRLSRFLLTPTGDGSWIAGPGSETVLIEDWCQIFPSHSVAGLRFGPDGALYASGGDGASFLAGDWGQTNDWCAGDPAGQGGAFRSQDLEFPGDPVTYSGTVIRVDKNTGEAMPDNPLVGHSSDGGDAVVAYGLRNPYRLTFRPGTSELWIGDVGWGDFEEVNVMPDVARARNYGWPCYEGTIQQSSYRNRPECQTLYSLRSADPERITDPYYAYRHHQPSNVENPCGGGGSSITGLAFYEGGAYPARYDGALFLADYSRRCLWVQLAGSSGRPDLSTQEPLVFEASDPVHLETGYGGDVFYTSIIQGQVRRIKFGPPPTPAEGGYQDLRPVARIDAPAASSVAAPLSTVNFSGRALYRNGRHRLPDSALRWELLMEHCSEHDSNDCHTHFIRELNGVSNGSVQMPDDHEYPSKLVIRLRASHTVRGTVYMDTAERIVEYPAP